MNDLKPSMEKLNDSILLEIENKKLHQQVLNNMSSTLKDISHSVKKKPKKQQKKKYGLSINEINTIRNMILN